MKLSVIIPAHNPRLDYLEAVLEGLRRQTLPVGEWDLLVVDNGSSPLLSGRIDLPWHPAGRILREDRLGLTAARLCGFRAAVGELVVLVDDDNVLAPDYLETAWKISEECPFLETWSGNVALELEDPRHPPPDRLRSLLCERAVTNPVVSNDRNHFASTPWGAGMCIRRTVVEAYLAAAEGDPRRLQLDLQGKDLVYGGDTDIAYTGCSMGLGMGVLPQLKLRHLIPEHRCTLDYLLRSYEARAFSGVLHTWVLHGVVPPWRRDLRGRVGWLLRWVFSDSLGRRMQEAQRRGFRRGIAALA